MSALNRLACRLRGHSWEQRSDPAGTIAFCSRCGKLRHSRGGIDSQAPGHGQGGGGPG